MRTELRDAARRGLAIGALLLVAGLVTVAARAVGPTLDRLAWSASLDRSADTGGELVLQQKRSDCGPAALKMILDHWGVRGTTLEELEHATGTDQDGTSMLALKRAAENRGVSSRGLRLPVDRLGDIPLPAIAHVHGDHFVVIRSVGPRLVIDDPSLGRLRMSPRVFASSWDGIVLTFAGTRPRPHIAAPATPFDAPGVGQP